MSARQSVYVSSTYADLKEFRRRVADMLVRAGYDVVAMEGYAASDRRPLEKCLADVRACDVYVGVVARRYGFIPDGYDRSITELEYQQAGSSGKPRLIFLSRNHDQVPSDEQLTRFRTDLERDHLVAYFDGPDGLASEVLAALLKASQERLDEDIERVRARQTEADRDPIRDRERVVNLPPIEVPNFIDRVPQRGSLHDFLGDDSVRMIKVVGRPGIGKTALATYIIGELETRLRLPEPDPALPDGLLYLSASRTGLSLERLLSDTLLLLDEEKAASLAEAWKLPITTEEKVAALLAALRRGRYIVLLDAADVVVDNDAAISEPGLQAFVDGCLRQAGAPLLVITSRIDVIVPPEALATVRTVDLRQGLGPDDAVTLLRVLDPQGELGLRDADPGLLERAAVVTAGIPRALELLAGILQSDPNATLEELLEDEAALGARTVEHLVREAYRRLGSDERKVMQALSVFRRPVAAAGAAYLLHPWFPGLDVGPCLRRLAIGHFVTGNRRAREFMLEAPDREHAYREIPDGPGYGRAKLELLAADFYASIRKPPEQWLSLVDIEPQLAEFEHCVSAGAFERALEVLEPIDDQYLGLWGYFLQLIELRERLRDKPARTELRAENLAGLAAAYQVIGEYEQAERDYREAIALQSDAAPEYVGQLGRVLRHLGLVVEAVDSFQQARAHYEQIGDRRQVGIWSDRVAYGTWYLGELDTAIACEQEAIAIAEAVGDRRTRAAAISNLGVMLQTQGCASDALEHQQRSLELTRQIGDRRNETIVLGRLGALAYDARAFDSAYQHHAEALGLAEAIGDRRERSNQLIGLGRALAAGEDFAASVERLEAARDLEVPETSFFAALALAVVRCTRSDSAAPAAFDDAVRRCRERIRRCDRLFAARYALATALAGLGAADAADAFEGAIANCAGRGAVEAALRDVELLRAAGVGGLERCVEILSR